MSFDTDVLVAGGGPVGLSVAIEARRRGLDVVVAEPRRSPVDKACGEGLMPTALRRLGALGVDPPGHPFVGIRYLRDGWQAEARFTSGAGRGVRRTVLHAALAARAGALGVRWLGERVGSVTQDADGVDAAGVRARWLVGADGLHSQVRREVGLSARAPHRDRGMRRYGQRRHFGLPPWSDHVEVYWSSHAEAYVTPVSDREVGVAVLGPVGTGFDEVLDDLPALRARLRGAAPVTPLRGAGPLRQRAAGVRRGRVLLAGDAAGYVDALTGEGLSVGLAAAGAAIDAVVNDCPEEYEARWLRATRTYRLLTTSLLGLTSARWGRAALVPVAAHWPGGFGTAVRWIA